MFHLHFNLISMETKDFQYFLDSEKAFCEQHPDYGDYFWNENSGEMDVVGSDDRLSFLMEKPFSKYSKLKVIGNEDYYGLTDAERVILLLFYGKYSVQFRDDYYYRETPELARELMTVLDSLVSKAPQNKDKLLYRFCHHMDRVDMNIGDIVTFAYNLTCTNFDWHQDSFKNVYIITPLSGGKTKAHNLFEIYEHGDEKQVDFLRGTSFLVTKIEQTEETGFKKIYLKELENK